MITKITVPSEWRDLGDNARQRFTKAEFVLGLGPCGKVVKKLDFNMGYQYAEVFQYCTDDSYKVFYYKLDDLCGRIEVEYA